MVAFPREVRKERREGPYSGQDPRRDERIKLMVKGLLESLIKERKIYLEDHPTKANGYYTRDLLTLAGPLEDLRVPRVREGDAAPLWSSRKPSSPFTLRG